MDRKEMTSEPVNDYDKAINIIEGEEIEYETSVPIDHDSSYEINLWVDLQDLLGAETCKTIIRALKIARAVEGEPSNEICQVISEHYGCYDCTATEIDGERAFYSMRKQIFKEIF